MDGGPSQEGRSWEKGSEGQEGRRWAKGSKGWRRRMVGRPGLGRWWAEFGIGRVGLGHAGEVDCRVGKARALRGAAMHVCNGIERFRTFF